MTDVAPPFVAIGQRIRLARELRKMTQGELAEACGITRQAVVLWEKGESEPGAAKLYKAADFLGATIEWLLTGSGEGPESNSKASLRALIRSIERRIEAIDAAR